jgi:hypothetical protein
LVALPVAWFPTFSVVLALTVELALEPVLTPVPVRPSLPTLTFS